MKYPWAEMKAGHSVFINCEKGDTPYDLKRKIGPSARNYGEKTGKRFKAFMDYDKNGVWVCRVK